MNTINLLPVPSQVFSVRLDDTRFVIRIKNAGRSMIADLERNGAILFRGMRLLANAPVIPYRYIEEGNFMMLTVNDELPGWEKFGSTQMLVYLTKNEVEALRHGQ